VDEGFVEGYEEGCCYFAWGVDLGEVVVGEEGVQRRKEGGSSDVVGSRHQQRSNMERILRRRRRRS
jgi:hypothetical protein